MTVIDDKILEGIDRAADTVLKHSDRWSIGQKLVAFAVCLLGAAALISGANSIRVVAGASLALYGVAFLTLHRRTIETQSIVLKDGNGKPRISISAEHGLVFFDAKQQPKVSLDVMANGQPIMIMHDDREQIYLAVTENGAVIGLADHNDSVGVKLFRNSVVVGQPGAASVTILGGTDDAAVVVARDTSPQIHFRLSDLGASLRLASGKGASIRLQASDDGNLGVLLADEVGKGTVTLGSLGGSAHLSFFGEDNNRIATYPDANALRINTTQTTTTPDSD